jgi:hypothetical protein
MMLADAAQASEGKLYILGGGWNLTGPEPTPSAIAVYIEVPWDLTNTQHQWRLELLNSDGEAVEIPTPLGDQPLVLEGAFEVGRPPGTTPGTGLGVPVAISLAPIPLRPGGRYEWRLSIGDRTDDNWRLPFSVRPGPPPAPETPLEGSQE